MKDKDFLFRGLRKGREKTVATETGVEDDPEG